MQSAKRLKNGAQGRICTADTRIFSPLLYSLSYLGPWHGAGRPFGQGRPFGRLAGPGRSAPRQGRRL